MNPRINTRDTPAPQWPKFRTDYAWHHIIPFPVLRDVWNLLIDQLIATHLAEARTATRQYLLLCGARDPNIETLLDSIRAADDSKKRASHHPARPLNMGEVLYLQSAAVWPPWNIVEGPPGRQRSDDPADGFMDRFTAGLTPLENQRMGAIEALYPALNGFIVSGPAPGPANFRALANAASRARGILGDCRQPISFRNDMWVQISPGRWSKAR